MSVDKDAMLHSLSAQVSYYCRMIQNHKGWLFAGVYADEGITGTKEKREEFVRLVQDAKAGKIDLIITKSISRFARNTLTLLKTVRELKAIGVDVYFEEQNLHSMSSDGEMILTLLASVAQEESRQVSENMKWRIQKDFQQGLLWGGRDCYGYKMVDRKFVIVPEEAAVVKRIFQMYLDGNGMMLITNTLNREGISPPAGCYWNRSSVSNILSNIIYTGCLLLQKSYVEDFLTKKRKVNRGELAQYLVEDDHEPIISMDMYETVVRLRKERADYYCRNGSGEQKKYPLTGMMFCEKCKKPYRHKVTRYNRVWICSTFNTRGKEYCNAKQIPEKQLYSALNAAFGYSEFDEADFKNKVKRMRAGDGNRIVAELKDGTEKEFMWQNPSRKDSWTEEMKEKARQKTMQRNLAKEQK